MGYGPRNRGRPSYPESPSLELRFALGDKRLRRLAVILGLAAVDVMRRFQVEAVVDLAGHGAVQVLLHIAVGHSRSRGETRRKVAGASVQLVRLAKPVR